MREVFESVMWGDTLCSLTAALTDNSELGPGAASVAAPLPVTITAECLVDDRKMRSTLVVDPLRHRFRIFEAARSGGLGKIRLRVVGDGTVEVVAEDANAPDRASLMCPLSYASQNLLERNQGTLQ